MLNLTRLFRLLSLMILLALGANSTLAQGTAFTYQGKLTDSGNPASGQYDFQFKLFDTQTVGTGTQQGSLVVSNVTVTNGIFSVQLDFGVCPTCFDGSTRFLEIAVKQTSGSTFTTLGPRQPVASNPYAIRSLNAATADGLSVACVNCVTGSQIASVNGSAVTGTIPVASVPAGSVNYIQNQNASTQSGDFNLSGNGTAGGTLSANVVNTTTQYNLGGNRVLSAGNGSLFVGIGTGASNTTGSQNSFFGLNAGAANTTSCCNAFFGMNAGLHNTGPGNSFFGDGAGSENTTANQNSFFGAFAGSINTTGAFNSFFGYIAGGQNTIGASNSFFGNSAGLFNTIGSTNSLFGAGAGQFNTTGSKNSFFGASAGFGNTTGSNNSFFGQLAGAANQTGAFNAFFGQNAGAANTTGSNNSFFGQNAGTLNTAGSANSFFGQEAGASNTNASGNSFFGWNAGHNNTTGFSNSFFGDHAGASNTTASDNAFFGMAAGQTNTTGWANAFFGFAAGFHNTTGSSNSFFGLSAGESNTTSNNNAFFGANAGSGNSTGNDDTFIGENSGTSNTTENRNTFLGSNTNGVAGIANATAIGAFASVTQSNSLVLGSINGVNNATADTSVGIGIRAPTFKLQVVDSSNTGLRVQTNAAGGTVASFGGNGDFQIDSGGTAGGRFIATESGNVGIGTATPRDKLEVNGIIRVQTLSGLGELPLCQNSLKQISTCPSSLRYKTDVHTYLGGLRVAMQLRPITFAWKDSGRQDIGFGAEDVAKIEPRLTFKNDKGEIEGVNYGQITTVLVNSIREQQGQIDDQQKQIKSQQNQIDALRKLICLDRPNADVCK